MLSFEFGQCLSVCFPLFIFSLLKDNVFCHSLCFFQLFSNQFFMFVFIFKFHIINCSHFFCPLVKWYCFELRLIWFNLKNFWFYLKWNQAVIYRSSCFWFSLFLGAMSSWMMRQLWLMWWYNLAMVRLISNRYPLLSMHCVWSARENYRFVLQLNLKYWPLSVNFQPIICKSFCQ